MSIQTFDELVTEKKPFPDDKNVRVLIAGLAFCKFTSPISTIEFLRHVPHHQLLMTISQMKRDGEGYNETLTVKIDEKQNVEILGALENKTDNDVGDIVGMKTIHGCRIERKDSSKLPAKRPTFLRLENCNFFTYKPTKDAYIFDDRIATRRNAKKYCEILGGYMFFSDDLTILIENSFPLVFSTKDNFLYEIKFTNSCDTTPMCAEKEDFVYMYDIVQESNNPHRKFEMIQDNKTIRTGACLPVCEDC